MQKEPIKNYKNPEESALKRGITKEKLIEAIIEQNGHIVNIAKKFGYKKSSRHLIYELIAKYDLKDELTKARGSSERLNELTKELASEITLKLLLQLDSNIKAFSKQQAQLLVTILKSIDSFSEKGKKDLKIDTSTYEDKIKKLNELRESFKKESENYDLEENE